MKTTLICNIKEYGVEQGEAVEVMENEFMQYESDSFLLADPVVDGLIYFRHPDAPWSEDAENQAKKLAAAWEGYVEVDGFGECPGQKMIGTTMFVLCWKDFGQCKAGTKYVARVQDFFGFGCDGFVIDGDCDYIDTMVDAVNHFVLC